MIKVSIIVPVYNAEQYISRCLDSILAQTLKAIEVICVDDGSTDQSGEILDRYALRDKRVNILHRENKGYGAAMNAGLDMAAGEYIGIVESDDCILPEMYQTLYTEAVLNTLDVVKSDAYFWYEGIGYRRCTHNGHLEPYYDRTLCDVDRNIFFDFYMNIWTGIYRRDFLKNAGICFHESPGASYQDNGFWMQTLMYCRNAKWLSRAFYLYRQDNEASSVKSKEKVMAMTREYEYVEKLLKERKDFQYLPYCYYYKLLRHRGNFYRIAEEYRKEFCRQIQKDFKKYKGYIKGFRWLEEWLHNVVINPGEFCDSAFRCKQDICGRLRLAGGLIIYGAGNHGDRVLRGLYNEGFYNAISCFAVSQDPPEDRMAGKRVLKIEDAVGRYPNALIIIAVIRGGGMYGQMVRKLSGLGINQYLDGTDIEENFYIL